ncbi:endocuticle structural glycoprotein ABD-5 isoform X2 [Halyomorpha halys]|uniref:endocuticle structural glycoprotein ABD-5 isoform X2 n=1 Tax=Halyomorpha halys TaxID=286706 RepID=UPI0006D4FF80|nr:pupal cuticle protein 20-like isoform X2 [Halyomorpha halys]
MEIVSLIFLLGYSLAQSSETLQQQDTATTDSSPIISFVNENHHNGSYKFSYQTSDSMSVEQEGYVREVSENKTVYAARGSYSYVDPNGKLVTVVWYADETGFHASGDNIPAEEPGLLDLRPGTAGGSVQPLPEFWRG